MTSKKVTLSADEATATVATATVGDIFTTALSTNQAITGMYGLAQKMGLIAIGMSVNSYRLRDSFNPLVK